jgi:hypothetical protein
MKTPPFVVKINVSKGRHSYTYTHIGILLRVKNTNLTAEGLFRYTNTPMGIILKAILFVNTNWDNSSIDPYLGQWRRENDDYHPGPDNDINGMYLEY